MTLICYSSTKQANTELKQSNSPANEAECSASCAQLLLQSEPVSLHVQTVAITIRGEEDQRKDTENNSDKVFWSPNLNISFI